MRDIGLLGPVLEAAPRAQVRLGRSPLSVVGLVGSALVGVVAVAGCSGHAASPSGSTGSSASRAPSGASSAATGTITVLAAASLQESFTTIASAFEQAHPGSKVQLSFGPSSGLAAQILGGAPGDVFASASVKTMATVLDGNAASSSTPFAVNSMEIAVPPNNPARITALADLARPTVKTSVCHDAVPCGAAATTVFANAKISVTPISEEADVKAVLTKIELGEVDAGLVYVTDVLAAGDKVGGISIPAAQNTTTTYPIASLTKAANPALAAEFVTYVLSADAQKVLRDAGFAAP